MRSLGLHGQANALHHCDHFPLSCFKICPLPCRKSWGMMACVFFPQRQECPPVPAFPLPFPTPISALQSHLLWFWTLGEALTIHLIHRSDSFYPGSGWSWGLHQISPCGFLLYPLPHLLHTPAFHNMCELMQQGFTSACQVCPVPTFPIPRSGRRRMTAGAIGDYYFHY